jgi:hypothetical protein
MTCGCKEGIFTTETTIPTFDPPRHVNDSLISAFCGPLPDKNDLLTNDCNYDIRVKGFTANIKAFCTTLKELVPFSKSDVFAADYPKRAQMMKQGFDSACCREVPVSL